MDLKLFSHEYMIIFLLTSTTLNNCYILINIIRIFQYACPSQLSKAEDLVPKIIFLESTVRYIILKGQCHEIFDPRFFSSNNTPWAPDSEAKAFLNSVTNSPRYDRFSNAKIFC
jgi:hypothetical protein